ncbi:MAG: nicotinate (nicotinamide) nucleotide adenylyltransferase [Candidatus Cryptobacteroides sp.]
MKIAVYSGSFNPLHIGHLAIMRHLTEKGGFDVVYLVVSPKNPLKDSIDEGSAEARLEAARAAVARHPGLRVKVDGIELGMPSPHYTVRTLEALSRREPENEFSLVIGADNLVSFRDWRDYGRILSDFGVIVFPREGFDAESAKQELEAEGRGKYRISLADMPEVPVSSTMIRKGLKEGKDMSALLM